MNERFTFPQSTQEKNDNFESLPHFPVHIDEHVYRDEPFLKDNEPELPYDAIVARTYSVFDKSILIRYFLRTKIADHTFIFSLKQDFYNPHSFDFQSEIEGYGFAVANLDENDREYLFKLRAGFIESVTAHNDSFQSIEGMTHANSYTIADIEECIAKIIEHPDNYYTAAELRQFAARYVINQIFEEYQKLYNQPYMDADRPQNKASARKRLFIAKFKKYLKTWEVVDVPFSAMYSLRRKSPKTSLHNNGD